MWQCRKGDSANRLSVLNIRQLADWARLTAGGTGAFAQYRGYATCGSDAARVGEMRAAGNGGECTVRRHGKRGNKHLRSAIPPQ